MRRQTKRRDKLGIARDTASRVSTEKSLSFRVGNGTSNLRPRPAFLKAEKQYGTRRPALLGLDVRRRHAVAVDRAATHGHLRCPRAFASKIRTQRCYNLIYK